MFTGIIEACGTIGSLTKEAGNLNLCISAPFASSLKLGESLAHNGVCLTVTQVSDGNYSVTLVEETLNRSNLGKLRKGDLVNLERSMIMGGRLDGHLVQGHVDCTSICISREARNGSTLFYFSYDKSDELLLVDKGSVCINGVSLTIASLKEGTFSVAIIPFTLENTNFSALEIGDTVNLEFDILGKYAAKQFANLKQNAF